MDKLCKYNHQCKRYNNGTCKMCSDTANKKSISKNPEQIQKARNRTRAYRKKYPEKSYAYTRKASIKKRFNITEEEYDRRLIEQGNFCFLCFKPPKKKGLHLDHCHKTGKIRKFLCNQCNLAIGLLQDSASILRNAADYLDKFNE